MFSNNSILKNVNILCKVISGLLILISLFVCKEPLFLLFSLIFILLYITDYKKIVIFNLIIIFFTLLSFKYSLLFIPKILLFILYILLIKKVTNKDELRFLVENTLYHFKNRKLTYKLLYIIYFIHNFTINIKNMYILKDDYKIKLNFKFIIFIIKQSYIKAKLSKDDFIVLNKIRFYNYSSSRTYLNKITFERWDFNYLACHIVILVVTIIYGG